MERRRPLVLTVLALAGTVLVHGAEPKPDACLPEALGDRNAASSAYARRVGGYCDGTLFRSHSGTGELPVIGIMAAPIGGDPSRTPIRLAPLAEIPAIRDVAWPLTIQGVARAREVNYRLDAILSADQPLVIGADSAMSRMSPRLRAEDVAWLARGESTAHGRTYIPLMPAGAVGGAVEVVVRPTIPAALMQYSILTDAGEVLSPPTTAATGVGRGQAVNLTVPPGNTRVVVVKVLAVADSGATQAAAIRLLRPGGQTR